MREEVNLWELPCNEISIRLKEEFREYFWRLIKEKFKTSRNVSKYLASRGLYLSSSTIRCLWSKNTPKKYKFIQGSLLFELGKAVKLDFKKIQKNVKSYKHFWGFVEITDPKLPIQITPEFDSIIANLMGDGTDRQAKNILSYEQHNETNRKLFKMKVESVFGCLNSLRQKNKKESTTVILPSVITTIFSTVYGKIKYDSHGARIPKIIKRKPRLYKVAVLVSFLVDEGTISDDQITIRLCNKGLLKDIREIAVSLGYKCSPIKKLKSKNPLYGFNISLKSASQLLKDVQKLSSIYPSCSLGSKESFLKEIVKRQKISRKVQRRKKIEENILKLLNASPLSTYEISKRILISRKAALNHLKKLERKKLIKASYVKHKVIWSKA